MKALCIYQLGSIIERGLLIFVILFTFWAKAQAQVSDTTTIQADSAGIITPANQDSVISSQSHAGAKKGEPQKGEVQFKSTDSLVFDFKRDRIATLYGSAEVDHKAGNLKAGKVKLNLDENIVRASTDTPQDTSSKPVLTRKGKPPVRSNSIAFNYKSKKGRFKVARINIKKGQIIGSTVKNTSKHVVFLKNAKYSTCTLPHPHYYIKAKRMKIVKKNGKRQIFFQHAMLYLLDIPYPFVFPFGYVPGKIGRHRQSGILTPTYVSQSKSTRGLGIRNIGWFQYFNDYITGQASVDLYTSGTYYLNAKTNYRKRNKYSGNIKIGYSKEQGLEPTDPDYSQNVQKNISITHDQTFSPYSNISASINLRTADYYKRNSYDIGQRAKTSTSSHINYNYQQPENLFTFNASMRQNINFATNTTTIQGPSFNFNLRQITPFKSNNTSGQSKSKWYQNISLTYQNSFQSNFTYHPTRGDSANISWFEALLHPSKYREATGNNKQYQYGFRQQAGISASNLLNSQYLNMSANINYTDLYVPTTIRKSFNPDSNEVTQRRIRGFATARDFSTSLNFSTTVYGIAQMKIGNIVALRHTLRPSISFSYSPDFSSGFFGYYRTVQTDTTGRTRRYSIFEDEVFSGPGRGEQEAINFSLNNVLEAKQVKRDTTGEKHKKILRLISQFNLSTSYNFAADSLSLSNLSASLTSSAFKGVNIRASANFNFYDRNKNGTRINEFLLTQKGKLAELTNLSVSANTSFSGGDKEGIKVNETPYFPAHYNPLNQSAYGEMDPYFNTQPVQPIESPWSFSINFRYSWNLNPNGHNRQSATINASNIQFKLTPKWSFSTSLGYDFIKTKFTPSQFSLSRKLHEWNLSFQVSPFGEFQYYFFRLSINSSALESIFQKLPLLKNLSRSSSPTGAGMHGGGYGGGGFGGGSSGFGGFGGF